MDDHELHTYLAALASPERLIDTPPHPPLPPGRRESWMLADPIEYAGLECWAWGLEAWGRSVVVRAACAAAERAQKVLGAASERSSPDLETYRASLAEGAPSIEAQLAAVRSWLAAPGPESLRAVIRAFDDERALGPDLLEHPELDELREEAWPWAAAAGTSAAVLVEHPEVARWAARAFVSAARALAAEGLSPEAACLEIWAVARATLAAR